MLAIAKWLDECAMAAHYVSNTGRWPSEITFFLVAAVAMAVILAAFVADWERNRAAEAREKLDEALRRPL